MKPASPLFLWILLFAAAFPAFAQNLPPSIIAQPDGDTNIIGQPLLLTVEATGTEPMFYRWRKNGVNISGATDSFYEKDVASTADSGDYTVVITNAYGRVTSIVATLSFLTPAAVTLQPVSKTVLAGTTVTFSTKVTGSPP